MATKKVNGVYHVSNQQGNDPDAIKFTEQDLTSEEKAQARENIGAAADDIPAVKYVAQTLTDAQKAQARTNINAPSVADLNAIGNGSYVESWDGASTPVVADIPAGVVVTYNTTDYTGTLAASASTVGKIYLVSTGTAGNYDRYITEVSGSTYSWTQIGTTAIDLSDYATKEEVSQLSQEVEHEMYVGDIQVLNLIADRDLRPYSNGTIVTGYNGYTYIAKVLNGKVYTIDYTIPSGYYLRAGFTQVYPASGVAVSGYFDRGPASHQDTLTAPFDGYLVMECGVDFTVSASTPNNGTIGHTVNDILPAKQDYYKFDKVKVFPLVNLFDERNPVTENAYIDSYGKIQSGPAYFSVSAHIPVKPSTAYCLTRQGGGYPGDTRYIGFYDSDGNACGTANTTTFTTPATAVTLRFTMYDGFDGYKIMLNEGSARAAEYVKSNPIDGYLEDSNVLAEMDGRKVPVSSKNIFGGTLIDSTMLYNDGGSETSATYAGYTTTPFIKVDAETKYSGSIEAGSDGFRKVCFYDSDKVCLGADKTLQFVDSFETPEDCAYVRISASNAASVFFMVALSDAPVRYQPHNKISGYLDDSIIPDIPNEKTLAALKKMKMMEWSELQFGLFLHWGVYSAWAGEYHGLDIDGNQVDTVYGNEWMWHTFKIPAATYKAKEVDFSSDGWNPDEICRMAQSVGMKYVVLTLRHHEGFSLFPTENCEWDVTDSSAAVDIVKQLKDACDRHHLKFCTYVSALLDWNDVGGFGQEVWHSNTDPYTLAQHLAFTKKQIAYVEEIVEKFDPWVVWYDGGTYFNQNAAIRGTFYNGQLEKFPYPIFNERGSGGGDYTEAEDVYADSPGTTEKIERANALVGWGYNAVNMSNPAMYPTLAEMLWDIFEAIGRGFNYLLNISPKGDGSIPSLQAQWLDGLAEFCRKYTFFNGARRLYNFAQPSWGRSLYIGNSVFLFIVPGPSSIDVDSVLTYNLKGVHIYGIASPDSEDNWSKVGTDRLHLINLPTSSDDGYVVVRLDFFNDVTCQDYNIVDGSISARSLVRAKNVAWASTRSGLRYNGTYVIGSDDNTTVSRFKYSGTTGSKTIRVNGSKTDSPVIAVKVYDESGSVVYSGTLDGSNEVSGVSLNNGGIYLLELKKTGSGTFTVSSVSII